MLARLKANFDRARGDGFVRSTSVLVVGTVLAQVVSILALPILTRLYSPNDFNVLAVFVATLSMLSVAACLRLEVAIPLPEHDADANNLLALSLLSACCTSTVTGIFLWLFSDKIAAVYRDADIGRHIWLVAPGMLFIASHVAFQNWATRNKLFPAIAIARLLQTTAGLVAQIGLGLAGAALIGLLMGPLAMSASGAIGLGGWLLARNPSILSSIQPSRMIALVKEYRKFPQYSMLEALINSASVQFPVLMIAAFVSAPEAGLIFLATRVMGAPLVVLGNAISQVYLSRASEEDRNGRLANFTAHVVFWLVLIGVGPLVAMGLVAPYAAGMVFGEEWARVGYLMAWMTPWFLFQFVSTPVSMVMYVRKQQSAMLKLAFFGLVLRLTTVWLAGRYWGAYVAETYAATGFVFYFVCYFLFTKTAGLSIWRQIKIFVLAAAGWAAVGGVLLLCYRWWAGS